MTCRVFTCQKPMDEMVNETKLLAAYGVGKRRYVCASGHSEYVEYELPRVDSGRPIHKHILGVPICGTCGEHGHISASCPENPRAQKSKPSPHRKRKSLAQAVEYVAAFGYGA